MQLCSLQYMMSQMGMANSDIDKKGIYVADCVKNIARRMFQTV